MNNEWHSLSLSAALQLLATFKKSFQAWKPKKNNIQIKRFVHKIFFEIYE